MVKKCVPRDFGHARTRLAPSWLKNTTARCFNVLHRCASAKVSVGRACICDWNLLIFLTPSLPLGIRNSATESMTWECSRNTAFRSLWLSNEPLTHSRIQHNVRRMCRPASCLVSSSGSEVNFSIWTQHEWGQEAESQRKQVCDQKFVHVVSKRTMCQKLSGDQVVTQVASLLRRLMLWLSRRQCSEFPNPFWRDHTCRTPCPVRQTLPTMESAEAWVCAMEMMPSMANNQTSMCMHLMLSPWLEVAWELRN